MYKSIDKKRLNVLLTSLLIWTITLAPRHAPRFDRVHHRDNSALRSRSATLSHNVTEFD